MYSSNARRFGRPVIRSSRCIRWLMRCSMKAHILGRLSEQLTEEQDDEQQHAKLEYYIVPVDVPQAVQDERCHAEHAQCGKRRNTQPELLRGLLAVRPEQHDQHRRNACRQKQVRQRQHINKTGCRKPVRRALCERWRRTAQ